jgi:hypothetical protein
LTRPAAVIQGRQGRHTSNGGAHASQTLRALPLTPRADGLYLVDDDGGREQVHFAETSGTDGRATSYAPGSAAFLRLVSRMIATGAHRVEDADDDPTRQADEISRSWIQSFGATPIATKVDGVRRCFEGIAVVRVRAAVAHDSYERLVEVACRPEEHKAHAVRSGLYELRDTIENAQHLGIDTERLADAAGRDPGIAEFCRFYAERRIQEMAAAGDDGRKRKKLDDDFTPRLELTVVALEGSIHREIAAEAQYRFDNSPPYSSQLTVVPRTGASIFAAEFGRCDNYGKLVPKECLGHCEMTGVDVLRHLLIPSEISGRLALPDHTFRCTFSGKRILSDEAELSAVTGRPVASSLLKTCSVTGKRAEPEHFGRCEFSGLDAVASELAVSDISGKIYRRDQRLQSSACGHTGHKDEFTVCHETRQLITIQEAERCEATGKLIRPGVLERCEVTGKAVLPSELERCAVTDGRVLKRLLVTSSVSGARLQHRLAVRSIAGKYCSPGEAKPCVWSGNRFHPDDLRICILTGISFHVEFAVLGAESCFQPLADLLHGVRHNVDAFDRWEEIGSKATNALGSGRCRVEAAYVSPDKRHLAVCSEVRTLLGLRVQQAGLLYSIQDNSIVGRIAMGKRTQKGWIGVAS